MIRKLVLLLILAALSSGCSTAPHTWLAQQINGMDCRPQALDAQGRCVPLR